MKRSLLVGTLLAGAGMFALVSLLTNPSPIYSVRVSELRSRGLWDREVRVQGTLVPKTLCKVDAACGYRFRIADYPRFNADGTPSSSREELSVSYDGCVLPDNVRDLPGMDVEVVVEGQRCQSCHDFKASRIMAKCTGKYEIVPRDAGHLSALLPLPRCTSLAPGM